MPPLLGEISGLYDFYAKEQDKTLAELTDDAWRTRVLERSGFDNLAEYLLAASGLLRPALSTYPNFPVEAPPEVDPAEPDEPYVLIERRRRDKIRELVRVWRERGVL